MALFDGVVNHRALAARKIIQLALGVTADGVIGPITAAAAETSDPKPVLARYFAGRANLYHQIIIADSRKSKFARGWFKRLFKVQQFILDECWPYKL
jgi:lysozyme family protein